MGLKAFFWSLNLDFKLIVAFLFFRFLLWQLVIVTAEIESNILYFHCNNWKWKLPRVELRNGGWKCSLSAGEIPAVVRCLRLYSINAFPKIMNYSQVRNKLNNFTFLITFLKITWFSPKTTIFAHFWRFWADFLKF
mgnify:CR=1 FL=1